MLKGHDVEVDYTCVGRMEEPQVAMQRNFIFAQASPGQPCEQNAAITNLDGTARRLLEAVTSAAPRSSQHARNEARARATCRTRCDDVNRIGAGKTRKEFGCNSNMPT